MISIIETIKSSHRALVLHKGRTALTMLGVIIGVFAVVSLVSVGIGIQNYVQDQFESLGANVVFVIPGKVGFTDDPSKTFGNIKFEDKHVELLRTFATDYIDEIAPNITFGKNIEYRTNKFYGTVYGVTSNTKEIFNIKIEKGRFFSDTEDKSKAKVAVISPNIVKELFSNANPIGKKIKIEDNDYEIVGITSKKGQDWDEIVYIPYKRVTEDFNTAVLSSITMSAKSSDVIELAIKEAKFALLRDLKEEDFSVVSAEDVLSSIQNVLGMLTAAIGAIAGISLLVGGIGIMNIMLVSVTERIKEIGLRKALGATSRDIALQFLFESVMIGVGGGSVGLLLGWLASFAGRAFVRTEVPFWAVLLAFGFSVLVGVIFGTYPAIKASKKDPIEALRFE